VQPSGTTTTDITDRRTRHLDPCVKLKKYSLRLRPWCGYWRYFFMYARFSKVQGESGEEDKERGRSLKIFRVDQTVLNGVRHTLIAGATAHTHTHTHTHWSLMVINVNWNKLMYTVSACNMMCCTSCAQQLDHTHTHTHTHTFMERLPLHTVHVCIYTTPVAMVTAAHSDAELRATWRMFNGWFLFPFDRKGTLSKEYIHSIIHTAVLIRGAGSQLTIHSLII